MSETDPQTNINLKDSKPAVLLLSAIENQIQDKEESKDQSLVSSKGQSLKQDGKSHSEKFSGPLEKPKTASKAFGSISDFLLFFENRNREIKDFAKKFQEMENSDPILFLKILNEEIRSALYKSFKNVQVEFKNHESSNKVALQPVNQNQEKESTQKLKNAFSKFLQKKKPQKDPRTGYIQLFEKEFTSLEEFYKRILYAYTIPGFLYLRMNEYLRTENWTKLDDLLIYTYCLFKAYLWGPTGLTDADSFAHLKSRSENFKLTLYRRADFDEQSLGFYRGGKIKEFSWTGVTSTSLLESATRSFAGKKPDKKPVLIIIEVDFTDLQPENFNALYLSKLSRCPAEEEVALVPGSIFELLEIYQDKSEVVMRLKLITNAKALAQQGKYLHGMLQAVMRNEDELKIVCLKEKELSRAIRHCKGNQLVAKIEFSLCNFNEISAGVLLEMLPTMKSLTSFTFNAVVFEGECHLDKIMECLGKMKIVKLEIVNSLGNDNDVKKLIKCVKYFGSLEMLKLSFEESYRMSGDSMREFYNEGMKYLDRKCVLELNMINDCNVIVKGLKTSSYKENFAEILCEKWPVEENFKMSLDEEEHKEHGSSDLSLIGSKSTIGYNFGKNSYLPKTNLLEALKEKYFVSSDIDFIRKEPLEILNLSFEGCQNINDQDLMSLEGLHFLQSLTTLNLNFNQSSAITNKALETLSYNIIQPLKGLNILHLSFKGCEKVTDEGLKRLACDSIQHLQFLMELNLSFHGCTAITDKGLRDLAHEGIVKIRSSLTSLHLDFESCKKITDEGFASLFHNENGMCLKDLALSFNHCSEITDKALEILSEKGLQNMKKSLKSLSLNFDGCHQITDEGFQILNLEGVSHLDGLTSLGLSFCSWRYSKITDERFKTVTQNSISNLSQNFNNHKEITNEGFLSLYFPRKLTTLDLGFNFCSDITDSELNYLSEGIKGMELLEDLSLNFVNCEKVTNQGLEFLCSQGLKHLQKLTS